jgi:CRP-like cAMP-binding protein
MRDIPRTASIRAETGATLLVLRRPDFLSAVLGTREIAAAAEAIIDRHAETTPTENQVALHVGGA